MIMSSYLTNSSAFQTKFPTHHAVRLGQEHFVNENWMRGRPSHALSIQINVFFFFPCQSSKNGMNALLILVNTTLVGHSFALVS